MTTKTKTLPKHTPTEKQLRAILDEAVHLAATAADTAEINASVANDSTQPYADDLMIRSHEESQHAVRQAEHARSCTPNRLAYYVRTAVAHAVDAQAIAGVEITAQALADWLDNPTSTEPPMTARPSTTSNKQQRTPWYESGWLRWRSAYTWAALALSALLLIVR